MCKYSYLFVARDQRSRRHLKPGMGRVGYIRDKGLTLYIYTYIYTHTPIYIYIYIGMYIVTHVGWVAAWVLRALS